MKRFCCINFKEEKNISGNCIKEIYSSLINNNLQFNTNIGIISGIGVKGRIFLQNLTISAQIHDYTQITINTTLFVDVLVDLNPNIRMLESIIFDISLNLQDLKEELSLLNNNNKCISTIDELIDKSIIYINKLLSLMVNVINILTNMQNDLVNLNAANLIEDNNAIDISISNINNDMKNLLLTFAQISIIALQYKESSREILTQLIKCKLINCFKIKICD